MQEHLATAIPAQATSGIFDATTASYLEQFQTSHGIPATGKTDPSTWGGAAGLASSRGGLDGRRPSRLRG